jgi:hypothetical protein
MVLIPMFSLPQSYLPWINTKGLAFLLGALLLGLALSFLLARWIINPTPLKTGIGEGAWERRPFSIAAASDYALAQPRLLVLRGYDDEATLTLAAGAIASRIATVLHVTIQNRLLPTGAALLGFAFLASSAYPGLLASDLLKTLFGLMYAVALIACFVLLLVPNLFRTVFGREFLVGAARCHVVADSVPDSVGAKVVTLPPDLSPTGQPSRMRHSIHAHPDCVREIANWLAVEARAGSTSNDGT